MSAKLVEDSIRDLLAAEPDIVFAFLFGSRATGRPRPDSDWDVGVYFDPSLSSKERGWRRLDLVGRLEDFGPVDLVPINDADPILAHRVLGGRALFIKDESIYCEVFVMVMRMAEDQRYFNGILDRARAERIAKGDFGRP
jgi:predicted nucleotidyltransferase